MTNLMMIKRLVDGDDYFVGRVEAACWVTGTEFTKEILRYVAADEAVQAGATLDEFMTIDSTNVQDEAILAAIHEYTSE